MSELTIEVERREERGSNANRRLRLGVWAIGLILLTLIIYTMLFGYR